MFNEFDKLIKLNIFLYNFRFNMAVINFKQTFDNFYTKFTLFIMSLDFIDWHKLFNFWQTYDKCL